MKPGSVFVDVAIDQGGCSETSRPTTHSDPTYIEEDVLHYCVSNMPGAVPYTSTIALANSTYPYIKKLVNSNYIKVLSEDTSLIHGVNIFKGRVTHRGVADSFHLDYVPPMEALSLN